MLPRDERRFKAADVDGDLTATREEFTAFLHPEEFEHMKEIVVLVRSMTRRKLETSEVGPLEYLCTQDGSQGRQAAVIGSFSSAQGTQWKLASCLF